ncbi:hypothetical protein BJ138DRAFT_1216236 [Hygrophoropsis aurantiaca]|uniref:Uncharacterized protein n=1 Tax=Hygrophoropsis aurantiaca TaxID=72124 RepID=A0ACB8A243_9AGAM|nr:hypothetical protein BJ138DRAFT_1216236 [Hygrophoropsis aurantiaca]
MWNSDVIYSARVRLLQMWQGGGRCDEEVPHPAARSSTPPHIASGTVFASTLGASIRILGKYSHSRSVQVPASTLGASPRIHARRKPSHSHLVQALAFTLGAIRTHGQVIFHATCYRLAPELPGTTGARFVDLNPSWGSSISTRAGARRSQPELGLVDLNLSWGSSISTRAGARRPQSGPFISAQLRVPVHITPTPTPTERIEGNCAVQEHNNCLQGRPTLSITPCCYIPRAMRDRLPCSTHLRSGTTHD